MTGIQKQCQNCSEWKEMGDFPYTTYSLPHTVRRIRRYGKVCVQCRDKKKQKIVKDAE